MKSMPDEHNLTPQQRLMPRSVRRVGYRRLPETCDQVRAILNEAQAEIMEQLEVPKYDLAIVDDILSRAFLRIRDGVTQRFRTEQLVLLRKIHKLRKKVPIKR